jgi:aspartyl-tRNA(Asn)/glutamyl-tRNA(Gln) amidotransferase subunit C
MDITDVKHLATLARLAVPAEEEEALLADLTSIIGYIDQITKAPVPDVAPTPSHRNFFREDVAMNEPGAHTDVLLASAASSQDGFVKVKKIL